MPDEDKSVQPQKGDKKMVPEADLIAIKKASERMKEELTRATNLAAQYKREVAEANSKLKIAKTDVEDDEEVKKVREYLLSENEKVTAERDKLDKDLTSLKEREREVGAKELATKYGIDVESISGEENPTDMKVKALELYAERLAKEKEETPTPESIYESATPGLVRKGVWDKSNEEFEIGVEKMRREALSKR